MNTDEIIAICESCDSEIYSDEMFVVHQENITLCLDCATRVSEENNKEKLNGKNNRRSIKNY